MAEQYKALRKELKKALMEIDNDIEEFKKIMDLSSFFFFGSVKTNNNTRPENGYYKATPAET